MSPDSMQCDVVPPYKPSRTFAWVSRLYGYPEQYRKILIYLIYTDMKGRKMLLAEKDKYNRPAKRNRM